jgi:exosortase
VLLCWVLAIRHLSSEWRFNEQYQFGWIVPLLSLYLLRVRMENAPEAGPALGRGWVAAAIGVITTLEVLLLPLQEANADWRFLGWVLTGLAMLATLVAFGLAGGRPWMAHFAFPVLFMFTAVPWPRGLETDIMQWLVQHNALLAAELLHWLGIEATVQGNLIQLASATVGIDEACSGIRSLQGALMVSLFVGEIFELGRWRRLFLLMVGIGWAFLTNAGRMSFLSFMTDQGGMEAHDRWHDPAGHWALAACVAGITLGGWLLGRAHAERKRTLGGPPRSTMSDWPGHLAMPASAASIGILLMIAGWGATEAWFRMQEASVTRLVGWAFQQPVQMPNFEPVTQPASVRRSLRYSQNSGGRWRDADGTRWVAQYFRWEPGLNDVLESLNHDPRVCLVASGKEFVKSLPQVIYRTGEVVLPFDAYLFRDGGGEVYVFNCVVEDVQWGDDRAQINTSFTVASRIEAARLGRRNLGRRRLEVAVWGAHDAKSAADGLEELLRRQVTLADHNIKPG